MNLELTREFAEKLDREDELAGFREEFYYPTGIYLDGNSLGLMSRRAESSVLRAMEDWKQLGVEGWTSGDPDWFTMAEELGRLTAPLIGAEPDEVIVTNSTTVNLHQLLATLFKPDQKRYVILTDALAFPSDHYALASHLRLRGLKPDEHLKLVVSRDGYTLDEQDIIEAMTDEVQLIMLQGVLYCSGQMLDMRWLTQQAHRRGILIGFDCAHSIGSVPHHLDEWDVDFAFWCTYKYLNSGPGASGGLYLNSRFFGAEPGLAGWFSSRKDLQFDMSSMLSAAQNAGALQIGTPNILSMAPMLGSLEMISEAGLDRLRAKSLKLTAYLSALVEAKLSDFGFTNVTPREENRRGGHIALAHPEAVRICKALKVEGVVPDYRPPNIVRLAPVALYTRFIDCYETVRIMRQIMRDGSYLEFEGVRGLVA